MLKRSIGLVLTMMGCFACGPTPDDVPGPKAPPPPSASAPAPTAEPTTSAATPLPPSRPPLVELQKNALKNMILAFNSRDAKKVAALYSADVISGSAGPMGWEEEKGNTAIEVGHTKLFAAFPDMTWASPRAYVSGNVVIQEWISNATHSGEFGGMKASGKKTGIFGISVYWFNEDGQITTDHTYFDGATVAQQVGEMPGKPRAIPALPTAEMVVITPVGGIEENKRISAAKLMYQGFVGADEKAFLEWIDENVTQTAYASPVDSKGKKQAAEHYQMLHKAFPDLNISITNHWAFGEKVIAEVTMTGTHKGNLGPLKASGKPVTLHSLDVITFNNQNKVTSIESYSNSLELLGQIGALGGGKPDKAPDKPAAPKPTKK
ncbi:MAG: ester cyclase [Polyangiaceae bacterium]|nr:ester cyclase [Polyangiaceae bacterium]